MTDINTELMKKFNWIPKMLDQVVSNKTSSNRRMTQSMNVIAREILGPIHTEKILNKTRINAANLRQKCIENGTVASPLLRKSRSFQTNQVENELRGVYNIGKDVAYKAQPKIKDVKPGERFKTEDTTLISLLGLLLGKVCFCYIIFNNSQGFMVMSTMGLVAKHHGTDIKSTIGASRKMSNSPF